MVEARIKSDFSSACLSFRQLQLSKHSGDGDMQTPDQTGNRRGREFDIETGQILSSLWELHCKLSFQQMLQLKEKADLCSFTLEVLESHRQNLSTSTSQPFTDIPSEFSSDTSKSIHARWFSNMYQQIFKGHYFFLGTVALYYLKKCPLVKG